MSMWEKRLKDMKLFEGKQRQYYAEDYKTYQVFGFYPKIKWESLRI